VLTDTPLIEGGKALLVDQDNVTGPPGFTIKVFAVNELIFPGSGV
jgi:hypothetical protein